MLAGVSRFRSNVFIIVHDVLFWHSQCVISAIFETFKYGFHSRGTIFNDLVKMIKTVPGVSLLHLFEKKNVKNAIILSF